MPVLTSGLDGIRVISVEMRRGGRRRPGSIGVRAPHAAHEPGGQPDSDGSGGGPWGRRGPRGVVGPQLGGQDLRPGPHLTDQGCARHSYRGLLPLEIDVDDPTAPSCTSLDLTLVNRAVSRAARAPLPNSQVRRRHPELVPQLGSLCCCEPARSSCVGNLTLPANVGSQ